MREAMKYGDFGEHWRPSYTQELIRHICQVIYWAFGPLRKLREVIER